MFGKHTHNFSLMDKKEFMTHIIFRFQCTCGQQKTKIVNPKEDFELEV